MLHEGMLPVKVLGSPQRLVQPRKVALTTKSHHCHPSLLVTLAPSNMELHQVKEGVSLDSVHGYQDLKCSASQDYKGAQAQSLNLSSYKASLS